MKDHHQRWHDFLQNEASSCQNQDLMSSNSCSSFPGLGIMVASFTAVVVQIVTFIVTGAVSIVNALGDFGIPSLEDSRTVAFLVFGPAVASAAFVLIRTFWMMFAMSSRRVATSEGKDIVRLFHELPIEMREDYEFRRMTEIALTRVETKPEDIYGNVRRDLADKWVKAGDIFAEKVVLEDKLSDPDHQLDMYISSTRDSVSTLDTQVKGITT